MTTGATTRATESPTGAGKAASHTDPRRTEKSPTKGKETGEKGQSRKAGQAATIHSPMTGGKDYHRSMTGGKAAKPHRSMTSPAPPRPHGSPGRRSRNPAKITVKSIFDEQNVNVTFSDRVLAPVFGPKNLGTKIPGKGRGYQKTIICVAKKIFKKFLHLEN